MREVEEGVLIGGSRLDLVGGVCLMLWRRLVEEKILVGGKIEKNSCFNLNYKLKVFQPGTNKAV